MKIERKYMAHYLNTVFAGDTGTAAYVVLDEDVLTAIAAIRTDAAAHLEG